MQTGDADVGNVQFVGAEMKRTLVAVLEFASPKLPLKRIECVIRSGRNIQLPQFTKHHSGLLPSTQYRDNDENRAAYRDQSTQDCQEFEFGHDDKPTHFRPFV
jgi:hypothetical protein